MVLHIYFFRDTSNLSTTSPGVVLFALNSSVSELILGSVGLESVKSKETVQIDYMYVCLSFYFTTVKCQQCQSICTLNLQTNSSLLNRE